MSFEDCKKVMIQYLNYEMSKGEFLMWAAEHCDTCEERVCHCDECPMNEGECKFPT